MKRYRPAQASLYLACGAFLSAPTLARAQSAADMNVAETLFAQGSALVDSGHYEEGCPKLESAQMLVVGIGVTLYVAACHEHRGQLLRAWEQFKKAEDLAAAKGDSRRNVAHDRAQRLWPQLAKLQIVVAAHPDSDLVIEDNDIPVSPSAWSPERPVEPGEHRIGASAPHREPWQSTIDVAPGRTVAVSIPMLRPIVIASASAPSPALPPVASASPVTPSPSPAVTAAPSSLGPQRVAALAVLGASAVGFGLGIAFGIDAKAKLDDSNGSGHCQPDDRCDSVGRAERSSALTSAGVSTAGFVAGTACLAGGLVLYLTSPKREPGVALVPRVEYGGASVLLERPW